MDEPILHGYTNERGVFEDSTFWNPTAFLHSGNMNAPVADVGKWVRALERESYYPTRLSSSRWRRRLRAWEV